MVCSGAKTSGALAQSLTLDVVADSTATQLKDKIFANCGDFTERLVVSGVKPRNLKAYSSTLKRAADYEICVERQRSSIESTAYLKLSANSTELRLAQKIVNLNRKNLWKPAPTRDPNTKKLIHASIKAGDEARAVLGKIPAMSCDSPDAITLRNQVNGNQIKLLASPKNPGEKQFAHINSSGQIVKWTDTIEQCDKPSLAGGVTECGTASRIVYKKKNNVTWVLLCRKSRGELDTLTAGNNNEEYSDYWSEDNPYFSLVGLIGHNSVTGETAFFDGQKKDWSSYRYDAVVHPPGGYGYNDQTFRKKELASRADQTFYSNVFDIKCHACHDNKNPWILDPHTTFKEAGFQSTLRKKRFSAGSIVDLGGTGRISQVTPFRIIGSDYIRGIDPDTPLVKKSADQPKPTRGFEYLSDAKSFSLNACGGCHTLTTQMTGRYLAYDALGLINSKHPPEHQYPLGATDWLLQWEILESKRTRWASEVGKIHPWMPAVLTEGGDTDLLLTTPKTILPEKALQGIRKQLDLCANIPSGVASEINPECGYEPLYSECTAPQLQPSDLSFEFSNEKITVDGMAESQSISWRYLNNLGGVLDRDDVRFDAAIIQVPLESSPSALQSDFPVVEPAVNSSQFAFLSALGNPALATKNTVRDIAPENQPALTDPKPSDEPRLYKLELPPLKCGFRYLASLKAKRFCFNTQGTVFSRDKAIASLDVECK